MKVQVIIGGRGDCATVRGRVQNGCPAVTLGTLQIRRGTGHLAAFTEWCANFRQIGTPPMGARELGGGTSAEYTIPADIARIVSMWWARTHPSRIWNVLDRAGTILGTVEAPDFKGACRIARKFKRYRYIDEASPAAS